MLIKSGSAPKKRAPIFGRIKTTTELDALSDAFIVVEAVTEDLAVKTEVFRALDQITNAGLHSRFKHFVDLDHETRRGHEAPDKVIGMHFMNPVPVMKLVEIIRGAATSDETYERVRELSEKLGKIAA